MRCNCLTDPDLVANDGIYSRYLTSYPAAGRYRFQVTADDDDQTAYTIQRGRAGRAMPARNPQTGSSPICCGSRIDVPLDLRKPTGSFRRVITPGAPVLQIISVPNADKDVWPPARIADLR